ncbi:CNNM domain-containing protein, partial [Fusobacterium ulcerans]|uniref:CNNM domain-containing protein n=1 Tax=Fusobacterium ulcerans TaxID=861 RepID=UPI0026F13017
MSVFLKFILLIILILMSIFLSISEISLASARKMKLQIMIEEGDENAEKVLKVQETSGNFFTAIQIGINAIAILGGIIGDNIAGPWVTSFIGKWTPALADKAPMIGSIISFLLITGMFIEFADLIPKRLAMVAPEAIAVHIISPMMVLIYVLRPLIFIFNGTATFVFRLFKIPLKRNDSITYDDIFAVVDAGAEAGVVQRKEHYLIENIFELDTRWVSSIMTTRDEIVYLTLEEGE